MELLQSYIKETIAELTAYPFLWKMLLAALLGGFSCSLLSVTTVLSGRVFAGLAIGLAAWTGTLAAFASIPGLRELNSAVFTFALCFALAAALAIAWIGRSGRIARDTAIGAVCIGCLIPGVLIETWRGNALPDVWPYLMNVKASVGVIDLYLLGGLALVVCLSIALNFRALHVFYLDPRYASSLGIRVSLLDDYLIILLALTVAGSMKVLGLFLTMILLVLPGASARLITMRFHRLFIWSASIAVSTVIAGFLISNSFSRLPLSLSIGLLQLGVFLFLFVIDWIRHGPVTMPRD